MKCMFFPLVALATLSVSAQTITSVAGGGTLFGTSANGMPATSASLYRGPAGGCFDAKGNYYFVELFGNYVYQITPLGTIFVIAGTGERGFSGDGGPATAAKLGIPGAVKVDGSGNIFIADIDNHRVRKIDATSNIITTVAGTGVAGYAGDGGPATAATLAYVQDICLDSFGNLYIGEYSAKIRKVNTAGIITTYAGNGQYGYSGDGARADTAIIGGIVSICFGPDGCLYMNSASNGRILKINRAGFLSTYAGTPTGYLYNGDDIPATAANINPNVIGFDHFGNLFIAETYNYRVRYVDVNGYIHTAAGNGTPGFSGDGGPATAAQFDYPVGIAFDSCNNLYVPNNDVPRIRKVTYPYCNYLSVNEVATSKMLTVYPNPASELLHINGISAAAHYQLADAAGRVLQAGPLEQGNNEVPIGNIAPGMYLLLLTNKDGTEVKKVIKQ